MASTPTGGPGGPEEELASARAGMFGLASRIFSGQPSVSLLEAMREPDMLESLAAFGAVFDEHFLAAGTEQLAEELASEFVRLFIGPGHHIAPYESVYVRGEGEAAPRLWGQATVAVADFFMEAGLELSAGQTPDHLGLELEAVAVLAEAEAASRAAGDLEGAEQVFMLQQRFCQEHLLKWVPAICREIENETNSSFYRNMASLTASLVEIQCGPDEILQGKAD